MEFSKSAKNCLAAAIIFMSASFPLNSFASIESNPSVPQIISRKTWGADESKMTWPVEYAALEKFIVHHTASSSLSPDTDGSGQYKSMVNAIYRYHTASKSWTDDNGINYTGFGDIGYNYLIDPAGNIYEGRTGGNGVIGGHSSSFNNGSAGISVIGNYQPGTGQTNAVVSESVEKSLARLIGWIAANNGIDVSKTSNFLGKTISGVVGHRDIGATSCPGDVLYAKMNEIRQDAALYAKEYKNYLYQIKGSETVYLLSGGYKTKYASKSALPDLLQGRAVQYISKAQLDAYRYKDLKILPDGTLLQAKGEATVYYVEDGKKRPMGVSESELLRLGFKASDIVSVSLSDLDLYETGNVIKFAPEGALVKDAGNNVYFIENGKKRAFTSAKLFEYLKYSWAKVKLDSAIDCYLNGEPMRYPNGTLMKGKDSPSVYMMENGKRRTFTSGALFERLGYSWNNILGIENSELNSYPVGGNMIYPDGTLIRGAGTSAVYLVDKGQKREITSASLFSKLGYSFASVVEIPVGSLIDYPTGTKASYPNGTLIKVVGGSAVYRVANGGKEEFTSLNLFNAVGAKWSNVVEISQGEMSLYPTVGVVKYPDGSLLRAKGGDKIYAMKNGQAVWIKTAEEFLRAGYKWANVMDIDPSEMGIYASDQGGTTPSDGGQGGNGGSDNQAGTEPKMRVAITSSTADSISITANGNYKIEYRRANGEIYKTVQKQNGETTEIAFFDWDNYIRFIPESDSVILQVLNYADPSYDKKTNDNRFRGVLELKYSTISKKLWVIEEVPLEGYLNGIAEAVTYVNSEYMKAFSTIARTYSMYYIQKGGKYAGEPFYLKNSRNSNGNDQVYRGYDLEMRAPSVVKANKDTRGQIVEFNNKPIVAAYSSDSGGVSKNACTVWGNNAYNGYCSADFAYLKGGVSDPASTVHDPSKVAASHGVGMSAVGAYQMALEGSDWQKIIKTYYPGAGIDKYYQ